MVQGGSSITQQMVKLTLLTQANTKAEREAATDDTYARKIRELRYAIAFEENYSKDWILERYLNIAYFGDGAYGIQSAAQHYFDKNAKNLNLRAVGDAGRPGQEPDRLRPDELPRRGPRAPQRRAGPDGRAQRDHPRARPPRPRSTNLGLDVQPTKNGCVVLPGAVLLRLRHQLLLADPALGKTVEERKQLLTSGGLTIRTTIDLRDPGRGRPRRALPRLPDRPGHRRPGDGRARHRRGQGARPVPSDGPRRRSRADYLNYAVPQEYGDSAGFQAGSTFKAFVLAAALSRASRRTRRSTRRRRSHPDMGRASRTATASFAEHRRLGPDNSTSTAAPSTSTAAPRSR